MRRGRVCAPRPARSQTRAQLRSQPLAQLDPRYLLLHPFDRPGDVHHRYPTDQGQRLRRPLRLLRPQQNPTRGPRRYRRNDRLPYGQQRGAQIFARSPARPRQLRAHPRQ